MRGTNLIYLLNHPSYGTIPTSSLLQIPVPVNSGTRQSFHIVASKNEIVEQCMHGVKSFDVNRPTALTTDWSNQGIGFWLCQKHCSCVPVMPGCCPSGWQTVYCGSRFCSPAEANYSPIEGEGLASTWGLDKCKFFLLGMKNFTLALDHRPLISIFVMNIPNPHLTSQKINTMLYSFIPVHVPGKKNVVPDCLSRRSDSPIPSHTSKSHDILDASNILPEYKTQLGPPSWLLLTAIPTGYPYSN